MKSLRRDNDTGYLIAMLAILLAMLAGCAASESGGGPSIDGDLPDGDVIGDGDMDLDGDADQSGENENDGDEEPHDADSIGSGDYRLRVDRENGEILLSRAGDTLLSFPSDGIQLGVVNKVSDLFSYDPWPLITNDPIYTKPEGLRWLNVSEIAELSKNEGTLSISLSFEENAKATLNMTVNGAGSFSAQLIPSEESSENIAFFRLRPKVDSEEAFYGLGENYDVVNHRGMKRAMQIEVAGFESSYNEAHVPIPFTLGTTGWGLFVECPYPGVFEMADEDVGDDRLQITFGYGVFASEGLLFHMYAAEHPMDVIKHYYDSTAYPNLPARWALGPWIWRDEVNDSSLPHQYQELVEYDLNSIRDLDLACTGYWIDRPYATAVNTFDWRPDWFHDAQGMIDLAHDLGMRMAIWQAPYANADDASDVYNYAKENGYFPPVTGLLLNNWSEPIDFTNPDAFAWWQEKLSFYTEMGIEGYKLDYAEDVVPGISGVRNKWEFFDGSDERTMHSQYQLWYHKVYAETLPEDERFIICRGGTYGDQQYANVIWPGDLDATFARHGEEREECRGGKKCVGGLPASMVAGLNLGASGFPFYGADTGGYLHSPPAKEVYMRWFEQTALSSVMQVGTSANNVPWEQDPETDFDAEVLDTYRIYARLHLRLWPYEWTYAKRIAETGHPIQRPLGLAYPELGEHPWDTYLFGEHLLVAPVLEDGARTRRVLLPEGEWVEWWTRQVYVGGQEITVDAPLDRLPLFLRAGGIVPLLRPTIDAIAPVAEAERERVDTYADTPGVLYPVVFAGEESRFVLFDGSEISQEKTDTGLILGYTDGDEFKYGALFSVLAIGSGLTVSATMDGSALSEAADLEALEAAERGYFYTAEDAGTLYVKVPQGTHEVELTF